MEEQLTNFSGNPLLWAGISAAMAVLLTLLIARLFRQNTRHSESAMQGHLDRLAEQQAQIQGALSQIATGTQTGHGELKRTLDERLDALSKRMGDSLEQSREKTGQSLSSLEKRLALIDQAQKNIENIGLDVRGLQAILANKQSRGAFGEMRMQDLVEDALPPNAYSFQHTLSTGKRIDCLIHVPNTTEAIPVDAKFPLESYQRIMSAPDDGARNAATSLFRRDVEKHISDIARKYLLPGETTDTALLFLPSEAIYAELYANFPDLVKKGFGAHVMIVSPTTFMAALHTISSLMKGVKMREQASIIQHEVQLMMKDVVLLEKRSTTLGKRFRLTEEAVEEILKSTTRITRHANKIEAVDVHDAEKLEDTGSRKNSVSPAQITKN